MARTRSRKPRPVRPGSPKMDNVIAQVEKSLGSSEKALQSARKFAEKAVAKFHDAETELAARSHAARSKGNAVAKKALAAAKAQKRKAEKSIVDARSRYAALSKSFGASWNQIKRAGAAQQKLIMQMLRRERQLLKKLVDDETNLINKLRKKPVTRKQRTVRRGARAATRRSTSE